MDDKRFDALLQSLSETSDRRGALRLFTGFALAALHRLGALSTEAKKRSKGKGKREGKQKVTLCHNGQTIRVSTSALKAHQGHDDTLGPCPTRNASPPPTAPPPPPPFQGICTSDHDACDTSQPLHNCSSSNVSTNDCVCVVTTSGASFCAANIGNPNDIGACSACTTDEECRQETGNPNAVCTRGGGCSCSETQPSFCSFPCQSMA